MTRQPGPPEEPSASSPHHGHHLHLSRRSFLVGTTAVAAAGAAAAALGYNRRGGDNGQSGVAGTTASPNDGRIHAAPGSRGGILRAYNFDAQTYDSVDPHLSQFGPIANLHSAVFSRLLRYEDEFNGELAPDLATAMPEQPDETTYVFRIRDAVRFHDSADLRRRAPGTAGRLLSADDVRLSIERQRDANSPQARRFFHANPWDLIDRIEVPDATTLVVRTREPIAPFLAMLAGRYAFVLPREVVDASDEITSPASLIGSGPFILESYEDRVAVRLRRNPDWFAADDRGKGDNRPYIEGYDAFFIPQEDQFQRAAFDRRIVDSTGFSEPSQLGLAHKTNLSDISLEQVDSGSILALRLLLDRPPFADDRARRALHLALDRSALIDLLYPPLDGQPSARLTAAVAPGAARWATDENALVGRPGYASLSVGRENDLREAKQLWTAALGSASVDFRMTVAGLPRALPERAVEALRAQLQGALGVNFIPSIDLSGHALISAAYQRNLAGATEGALTCTLAVEDGGIDLDDWLYPAFHSHGRMNTYRVRDPQLDNILERQRQEFDMAARRRIGIEAQDYLAANVNARIEICAPIARRLVWGYVRNGRPQLLHGANQDLADVWLDASHPAHEGRPARVP